MCYAEFLSDYIMRKIIKPINAVTASQKYFMVYYVLVSQLSNETFQSFSFNIFQRIKEKCIFRYHIPNQTTHPEEYVHHTLFMFFPFRNESDLNATVSRTYSEKLLEPTVTEIVNKNRKACEPFADSVDEAFIDFIAKPRGMDQQAEQENEDVRDEIIANATIPDETDNNNDETFCVTQVTPLTPLISDEALGEKIRSLNKLQREVFDFVNKWARDQIKSKN